MKESDVAIVIFSFLALFLINIPNYSNQAFLDFPKDLQKALWKIFMSRFSRFEKSDIERWINYGTMFSQIAVSSYIVRKPRCQAS